MSTTNHSLEPEIYPQGEQIHGTEVDQHNAAPRREILDKIGRFAYVAPTMLLLTDPANAQDGYKVKKPKKDK